MNIKMIIFLIKLKSGGGSAESGDSKEHNRFDRSLNYFSADTTLVVIAPIRMPSLPLLSLNNWCSWSEMFVFEAPR